MYIIINTVSVYHSVTVSFLRDSYCLKLFKLFKLFTIHKLYFELPRARNRGGGGWSPPIF